MHHHVSAQPSPSSRWPILSRGPVRALAAAALAAATVLATAASASAHVHVIPDGTSSGAYVQLTFRVPNESAKAGTVKLVATLPQARPIPSVATKPVPGWTATVREAGLPTPVKVDGTTFTKAPRTVTWTATKGHAIAVGQYQEFSVSAGPLPAPGPLVIPVAQYYSDGTIVRWDEPTVAGKDEPEHPAPSFLVTASNGTDDPSPLTAAPATAGPAATSAVPSPAPSAMPLAAARAAGAQPDALARWLSGAALLLAAAALALIVTMTRRRTGAAPVPAGGSSR